MNITLKEIAEKANVSISTVSRILNGPDRNLDDEKSRNVLAIAKELGYFKKKAFTLSYASRKKLSLGCIFTSEHESFLSPFFSDILSGIKDEMSANAPLFDLSFTTFNLSDRECLDKLADPQVDGAIILGRTTEANIRFMKTHLPHLVYAGLNRIGGTDEVICDAKAGVKNLVSYLLTLGHSDIGFIGATRQSSTVFNEYRYEGFAEALKEGNLTLHPEYVEECFLSASEGYQTAKRMILSGKLPTAIICGNDNVAIGVEKALADQGIRVPADISVTGFDDIADAAFLKPALTTIAVPRRDLGRYAVKVLLDSLTTGRDYKISVQLPFHLEMRESTAKRKD
jgi:DNA-binding LacI/PurR family transcriptional regulator